MHNTNIMLIRNNNNNTDDNNNTDNRYNTDNNNYIDNNNYTDNRNNSGILINTLTWMETEWQIFIIWVLY